MARALTSAIFLLPSAITLAALQTPTFKSAVTHVLVDVVVTDKDDRPVTDLKGEEFIIREAGKPQTLADFERILVPLADRVVDLKAVPAPPPDTASNVKPAHTARAFVFVMDNCTLQTDDIVPIKRVMADFVKTLTPEDTVALTYVGRSDLGHDFTHDEGQIVRAINDLTASFGSACMDQLHSKEPQRGIAFAIDNAAGALEGARELRRAVVLVSGGYVIKLNEPEPAELLTAFDRARHAGVPIYTLDPHGLVGGSGMNVANQWMRMVAENTGGLSFVNTADVGAAARNIIADNGAYYLLGYYPSPYVTDGKFHEVEVKVTRPGLHVRARAGYMTEKPRPDSAPPPRLVESLTDGTPGGDLILRAFAAPVAITAKGMRTLLTLDVSYPDSAAGAARVDDELEVTWVAVDPDAKIKASGENTVKVPLTTASRDALTLTVEDGLELPKGHVTLRVAVKSKLLGTEGTVHLPLDVPDLSAKLGVSPLVLGLDGGPQTRLATLGDLGGVPFQPTPLRTFTFGRQFRVFARVFASSFADVTAALVLKRGDAVVQTLPITAALSKTAKNALDCEATLPFRGLAKGLYALELTVSGAGQKDILRALAFEVR